MELRQTQFLSTVSTKPILCKDRRLALITMGSKRAYTDSLIVGLLGINPRITGVGEITQGLAQPSRLRADGARGPHTLRGFGGLGWAAFGLF